MCAISEITRKPRVGAPCKRIPDPYKESGSAGLTNKGSLVIPGVYKSIKADVYIRTHPSGLIEGGLGEKLASNRFVVTRRLNRQRPGRPPWAYGFAPAHTARDEEGRVMRDSKGKPIRVPAVEGWLHVSALSKQPIEPITDSQRRKAKKLQNPRTRVDADISFTRSTEAYPLGGGKSYVQQGGKQLWAQDADGNAKLDKQGNRIPVSVSYFRSARTTTPAPLGANAASGQPVDILMTLPPDAHVAVRYLDRRKKLAMVKTDQIGVDGRKAWGWIRTSDLEFTEGPERTLNRVRMPGERPVRGLEIVPACSFEDIVKQRSKAKR